jgi:predicted nucleic acid-binding protein
MNSRDTAGRLSVCIPAQVLMEFVHVITWRRLENPLSLPEAIQVVEDYLNAGVIVIYQHEAHLPIALDLLKSTTTRKKVFDIVLAATLKENGVLGLYTVNVADFEDFDFLEVINPLQPEEAKE